MTAHNVENVLSVPSHTHPDLDHQRACPLCNQGKTVPELNCASAAENVEPTEYVIPARPRQEGFEEAPAYPLSEVDADTLATMCSDFRAAVFAKAGKPDPAKETT